MSSSWQYEPRRQRNYLSSWTLQLAAHYNDDVATGEMVERYYEVLEWYKEMFPKKRSMDYPTFDVQATGIQRWDHRMKAFGRSFGYRNIFSISVTLPTDADDIAFRMRFAPNGYIDLSQQQ